MPDILDEIDDVITWYGSVDSATWLAPWDEPVIVPGSYWRQLMDREGWDGYTAAAYARLNLSHFVRECTERMKPVTEAFMAMQRAAATKFDFVLLDETLIADPVRVKALEVQRTRNTGPAPRRLDGRHTK